VIRFLHILLIGALAWGAAVPVATAHPHIFIDARATVIFDDDGAVIGVRHEWAFDEAFSAWSVEGLDADGDGVVSQEEQQELADQDMEGLAEYQYYTFAGEGDDNLVFAGGEHATRNFVDGRTILRFGVALSQPYRIRDTLELAIHDPEYYVAITFADASAVTLENAPAGCAVQLRPAQELPDALADQLYALPPDVTVLPPNLAAALRGVQGGILVSCPTSGNAEPVAAASALEAVNEVAQVRPALPFGGPPAEPGFTMPRTGFLGWIGEQQRSFYQALTEALGQLRTDNTAFWLLGTLSFLYGVFHAAGPGHGKVVISSYMLANERQVRRGILLSFAAAMMQSLVAVTLVGVAIAAFRLTSLAVTQAAGWIGILSYGLMALLGLWLIGRKLFGWGHSHGAPLHAKVDLAQKARAHLHGDHDHHHHHDDEHHHHHAVTPEDLRGDWREQLGVVLAVGLRPCSGALVVLVFALSQDVLAAGIAAVFLMGLGTALTVAILAVLAVSAKGMAHRLAGAQGGAGPAVIWWTEMAGAVVVFGFGAVLLLASI
jgi:nickel/cobalt transporter (NicO) family protein